MSTLAPSSEYLISPCCSFCLPLQKPSFAPAFWKSQFWCSIHPNAGNSDKYDQSKSEWPHSLCRSSEPGEWPDPSFETWREFCWWALRKVLHSLQTPRRKGYFLSLNVVYTMTPGIIVGVFWSSITCTHTPQTAENDSLGKIDRRKPQYLLFVNPLSTHSRTSEVFVISNRVGCFLIVSSMHVYWYRPLHKQLCCWGIVTYTVHNPGENAAWGSSKWFSLSHQLLFRPSVL